MTHKATQQLDKSKPFKTVSVSQAKNKLSAVLEWAVANDDEIVVESRGEPKAVILSYGSYEELLKFRDRARRAEAMQKLDRIAARTQKRNADLDIDEIEQMADKISDETMKRIIKEKKAHFKP